MTIEEMHYDFNMKFNKVDSQQNRNILIPEKDWLLNEAAELFVKMVAKPRVYNHLGFERTQRTIDDIRTIVVNEECLDVSENNTVSLPNNYWHYVRARVKMTKGSCEGVEGEFKVRQHDDSFEQSPFDKSSFEWRTVNGVFFDGGIKFYTDGTFNIDQFCLSYIRKMTYMHFAEGFRAGGYRLSSNAPLLIGSENCELPEHTHREIVDIAVLLASGQIQTPDYQVKLNKLNFNNLK